MTDSSFQFSPRILIQTRRLVKASLASAVTVLASSLGQVIATSALFGPFVGNTIINARLLSALILAHSGDAPYFTLQAANMDVNSNTLVVPAFSGSSLGLAGFASLQAGIQFHIEDIASDSDYPSVKLELFALVENTDSGASHKIDSMDVVWEVFTTQFDQPLQTPFL